MREISWKRDLLGDYAHSLKIPHEMWCKNKRPVYKATRATQEDIILETEFILCGKQAKTVVRIFCRTITTFPGLAMHDWIALFMQYLDCDIKRISSIPADLISVYVNVLL